MKRNFTLILFLIFFLNLFGFNIDDYILFSKGEEAFKNEDFISSTEIFSEVLTKYPDSNLFKSTYGYYFLAESLYNTGKFSESIDFFNKTKYFPAKSAMFIAKSYLNMEDNEKAIEVLNKMYTKNYNYYTFSLEKEAFSILSEYNEKYTIILDIRYNNNFTNISKLSFDDLVFNGDFFSSKGDFGNAIRLYRQALNLKKDDDIEIKVLSTMFLKKDYVDLVNVGLEYYKNSSKKEIVAYHIGDGYRRQGNIPKSIEYMLKATDSSIKNDRNLTLGRLYYLSHDYENALKYLNETTSFYAEEYIIKSYEKMGNQKDMNNLLVSRIKNQPYSDKAAEYRYRLYENEKNKNYLHWIIHYNINSYYYELASNITKESKKLPSFDIENKMSAYKDFFNKTNSLSKLNNSEFLKIEFDYTIFPKEDAVFKAYLRTKVLEENKKYYDATINSWRNNFSFSQYKELVMLLYPKYYREYIENSAKKYGVDPNFVYSIIKQESLFKEDTISKASAYGLMQIIIPTAQMFDKNITPHTLLEPEKNIDIGVQYLKFLLKKYNGNMKFAAAAYNAGPHNVDKWIVNNDLDVEKIPYTETKQYVKKVLTNYNKYSTFY
ncbi:MAG: transglycosylase SLT domain-containing protein [Fusobacteria bacterium]|nr:transglycosylase SLT domain-containing protein [Fusobacteriota bacterium]